MRSSNQPGLHLGTALPVYERQNRAGCEVGRSISCSKRWEQNGVTLSKPEGWEVITVGAHWRVRVKKREKEEGNRVGSKIRNHSKLLRARLCHADKKPVRQRGFS